MGLDCSHGAWSGPYSYFGKWREALAYAAGMPPLKHMEGFQDWTTLESRKAIQWNTLPPDILHVLLNHSDCDGEIAAKDCAGLAVRLAQLREKMNGEWEYETSRFITGLILAAEMNEPLEFH